MSSHYCRSPTQCITSIAVRSIFNDKNENPLIQPLLFQVGRMMMNIRGLMLDDPEHTVHLRTLHDLQFVSRGEEIESVD